MKNLLKFTAVLLIVAGAFACSDKEQEAESAPVEFTEYSLAGTGCQWTNLSYDGKVIAVNSKEDLEKYITGTEENLPYVDFSTHTLLLASDSDNDVRNIDAAFFKNAANQYTVKVSIYSGDAAVMTNWELAILTSKIPDGSSLALEKEENDMEILEPCNHPLEQVNTLDMETRFFKDHQKNLSSHIFIDKESNSFMLRTEDAVYEICNFPEAAKEWTIPDKGLTLIIKGNVFPALRYHHTGFPLSFDLELTTLIKK
jgi:hypothetical protein